MFISSRPGDKVSNEVSIIIGYPFKSSAEATVEVGTTSFALYTQQDGAWIKNATEEARLIEAMRAGQSAVVKGTVGEGHTNDRHILPEGSGPGARSHRPGLQVGFGAVKTCSRTGGSVFSYRESGVSPIYAWTALASSLGLTMTAPLAATQPEDVASAALIEKRPLERYVAPAKPSLVGLSRAALSDALGEAGVPERQRRMRVQQIWHWLYVRGAQDFDAMTTLSKELRAELAERFTLARPEIVAEQVSVDGTRKWLLRLPGEVEDRPHEVECVYIPETDRGTLCISSQVGCTLNCTFCHTGTQRLVRNLTPGEIVGQVVLARDRLNDWQRAAAPAGADPEKRLVSNVVHDGHGRAAVQFRSGARRHQRHRRR